MRYTLAAFALAAVASANPGGVSGAISPSSSPPGGCSPSYSGDFEITPTNLTSSSSKRSATRPLRPRDSQLAITLSNGVLMDTQGRTGYVAANSQFQFDDPPQAGAIYTAGFAACSNGSLALGDDAIWYSCLSGNFYNLYYTSQGGQCFPVTLQIVGSGSTGGTTAPATTAPPATSSAPPATSAPPSETSAAPCTEYVDGQPQCTTAAPAPSAVCSEYVDGQPQCSSAAPSPVCSEYVDGQPQCSSAAPSPVCSEYVDGQPQCSSAAPAVCSEYVDGQPQCGTGTAVVASASYTGAPIASGLAIGQSVNKEMFGLAAGVLAFAML